MIKFEKVSYEQWVKDAKQFSVNVYTDDEYRKFYDGIKLPERGTKKSAGYDFFAPYGFLLEAPFVGDHNRPLCHRPVVIPTGIRIKMNPENLLLCLPRSGSGSRFGVELANTAGVIDADYYNADNEGHILAKLMQKDMGKADDFACKPGDAFMQGIILTYSVTDDDDADGERTGGFGSTDKKE